MFSLVVVVTAWQGDLSRAFSEGGVGENVNFKICIYKLEIKCCLHPMTTKCSYDHEKVCTNINQLFFFKLIIVVFFWVYFLIKKYPVFIIF